MHELPHHYRVSVRGAATGPAQARADGPPPLTIAPPAAFDGPGDQWSPEELVVGAVVSCLLFTFQAIARASKAEFTSIDCQGEGILDRVEGGLAFREIIARVKVTAPAGGGERLQRLVQKAEQTCLVTRSLRTPVRLEVEIATG